MIILLSAFFGDRKGKNEIDIIAVNEPERCVEIIEVKRNADRIDRGLLMQKGNRFLSGCQELKGYDVTYKGLSLEDM